jgi:hypothetical protein
MTALPSSSYSLSYYPKTILVKVLLLKLGAYHCIKRLIFSVTFFQSGARSLSL